MDHTMCHFEIPVEDMNRAAEFYRSLFGWEIKPWDPMISMVHTVPVNEKGTQVRPGLNGMLIMKQHPRHPFANYVSVEDVDEYANKAIALGGQIAMPKTPVPGMGWFAYILDTEGTIMGLWQTDSTAAPA